MVTPEEEDSAAGRRKRKLVSATTLHLEDISPDLREYYEDPSYREYQCHYYLFFTRISSLRRKRAKERERDRALVLF